MPGELEEKKNFRRRLKELKSDIGKSEPKKPNQWEISSKDTFTSIAVSVLLRSPITKVTMTMTSAFFVNITLYDFVTAESVVNLAKEASDPEFKHFRGFIYFLRCFFSVFLDKLAQPTRQLQQTGVRDSSS